MQVKITYNSNDNAIFTGVTSIVEKSDGYGSKVYSLYSAEGLLYSIGDSQIKTIEIV